MYSAMWIDEEILIFVIFQLNKAVSGPRYTGVIGERGSRESKLRNCTNSSICKTTIFRISCFI